MDKNIKENASFYAMSLIAIVVAVLGITANSIYSQTGGYALGAGCAVVALVAEFFVFAISPQLTKTRTKGMLFFTSFIVTIYAILFILGDLARIKVYSYVFVGGAYVSKLQGLGKFALVFEIACIVITLLFVARLSLNLFGKEIKPYEKMLGTFVVRRKEVGQIELDLPEKDTAKLVAVAGRAVSDEKFSKAIANSTQVDDQKQPIIKDAPNAVKKENPQRVIDISGNALNVQIKSESGTKLEQPHKIDAVDEVEICGDNFSEKDISQNVINESSVSALVEPDSDIIDDDSDKQEPCVLSHGEISDSQIILDDIDLRAYESTAEVYADSTDVGGVLSDNNVRDDVRTSNIINHITEQVESADDDIYGDFNYDDED